MVFLKSVFEPVICGEKIAAHNRHARSPAKVPDDLNNTGLGKRRSEGRNIAGGRKLATGCQKRGMSGENIGGDGKKGGAE